MFGGGLHEVGRDYTEASERESQTKGGESSLFMACASSCTSFFPQLPRSFYIEKRHRDRKITPKCQAKRAA